MTTPDDDAKWDELCKAENQALRDHFHRWLDVTDKLAAIERGLASVTQRGTALRLLLVLGDDFRKKVFPQLVFLASWGNRDILLCRTVIKSMHRKWVIENIESQVQEVLAKSDGEEEWRCFAELCWQLDDALLARHVELALAHPDKEIQAVGRDYQA